jgi:hypothetical protein
LLQKPQKELGLHGVPFLKISKPLFVSKKTEIIGVDNIELYQCVNFQSKYSRLQKKTNLTHLQVLKMYTIHHTYIYTFVHFLLSLEYNKFGFDLFTHLKEHGAPICGFGN